MEPLPPELSVPASVPPSKINWLLVAGLLIGPAVLALVGAMAKVDALAIGSPLLGGGIGGIVCGVILGRRLERTTAAKVCAGVCLALLFACLTVGLGFFGCMLGGFKMDFK